MLLLERLPARKTGGSFDRVCAPEHTLAHEAAIRAHYGITRVAELTHLDRIGIPVYSAIVPDSKDSISVYNGKGLTVAAARAGAIMEAAERGAVALSTPAMRRAGFDPFDGRRVEVVTTTSWSSNGLASGNVRIEAIYHALCELIERHVLSVVHAIAHVRPREVVATFAGARMDIPGFIDDAVATDYVVPTGSPIVDDLCARIIAAGCAVHLRAVELHPFPLVFIATIDDAGSGASRSHSGFGCSLSPEHAAVRALTEAAQGRLCDIQGAREDLRDADDRRIDGLNHRRFATLPHGSWFFDGPARRSSLATLADRSTTDIASDVDIVLQAIRAAGFARAAIVDLSPRSLPISVVHAIVPGLETAMLDGAIGPLITKILDVTHDIRDIDLIVR